MRTFLVPAIAILALWAAPLPLRAEPVARFSELTYRASETALPAEGRYRNPVLPGFHPDPSLVKVGDDFYLVTSTFGWFPGIPVFHSKDLVNWTLIGHAIDRPGQLDLAGLNMVTDGVYAPAITWHEGTFYIFNTCVRCGENFYVTATDPAGPWSDPVWVDFAGIDPSLFFDEDGSAWVINNDLPEGGPQYEGHRALWVQRIDLATGAMTGPRTMVVDGGFDRSTQPIWAEGPHIFRKDGWYYINAAEGGTAEDHSQTIYRSRSITGPYQPGPTNPTLTQRDLPRPRPEPVEATGHADFVELDDGSWWAVFLATRPFAEQLTLLGRETWLLPVSWEGEWPRVLAPGKPVPWEAVRPNLPAGERADWSYWREDFAGPLSGEWLQMRNPAPVQWYLVDRERGELVLFAGEEAAGSKGKPHVLARRMRHPRAEWTTRLTFAPEREGDFAGLLAFASEAGFLAAGIEQGSAGRRAVVRRRTADGDPVRGALLVEAPLAPGIGEVELRLRIADGRAAVDIRPNGRGSWRTLLEEIDVTRLASVHSGLFTGLTVGPYAVRAAR